MIGELIGGALAGGLQAGADIADQAWKEAQEAKKQAAEMGLFKYKIDAQVEGQKEIAKIRVDGDNEKETIKGEFDLMEQDLKNRGAIDNTKERNKRPVGSGGSRGGSTQNPRNGANAIASELKDLRKQRNETYDKAEKEKLDLRIGELQSRFDSLFDQPLPSGPATGQGVRRLSPIDSVNPKDGVIDFRDYSPKKQGK